MAELKTWRWGSGLIEWIYNIGCSNIKERSKTEPNALFEDPVWCRQWVASKIERLLDAPRNFARVESISVDTRRGGEDSWVVDEWQPQESRSQLLDFLCSNDDTTNINIVLTLECEVPVNNGELKKIWIESGATILVFVEIDERGKLLPTADCPIWFTFFLDVDIYAPLSWGEIRDNAELAELNQPRLSAFLHRLEEELGAEFLGVSASDYSGMVERYGFVAVGDRRDRELAVKSEK